MIVQDPIIICKDERKRKKTLLTYYQIAYWDETQIKQCVGKFRENSSLFAFDENGNYDPSTCVELIRRIMIYCYQTNWNTKTHDHCIYFIISFQELFILLYSFQCLSSKVLTFAEEGHISFAVCGRNKKDGEEDVRLEVYDYTYSTILV